MDDRGKKERREERWVGARSGREKLEWDSKIATMIQRS